MRELEALIQELNHELGEISLAHYGKQSIEGDGYIHIINKLQALTPTTLEALDLDKAKSLNELRDEIISELNIINLGRVGKGKWIYQNNKFIKKEKDTVEE